MSDRIRISGEWPSPITLTNGWSRATARPWNDTTPAALVRLERGTREFLASVTEALCRLTGSAVLSPAIYPQAARLWLRCGFEPFHQLEIMERPTIGGASSEGIIAETEPDWDLLERIDSVAFEGFWRMSRAGHEEALGATRHSAVLVAGGRAGAAYAIVGAQWSISYLQRLAVHPAYSGRSLGSALVEEALSWGRQAGTRVMVLNVREGNLRARRLYDKAGFTATGTHLSILRYAD